MRDGRPVTVDVTADGVGVLSHAGSALLARVADKVGLTSGLSVRLAVLEQRRRGHDPGRVIRDLAVMLADGGECVSDLGAQRDQGALFGRVASDSTAFRMVDKVASTPGLLAAVRAAHAQAIQVGLQRMEPIAAFVVTCRHLLLRVRGDQRRVNVDRQPPRRSMQLREPRPETSEALGGLLRPGNAA
jgi:Transposase DDE domain group 1